MIDDSNYLLKSGQEQQDFFPLVHFSLFIEAALKILHSRVHFMGRDRAQYLDSLMDETRAKRREIESRTIRGGELNDKDKQR